MTVQTRDDCGLHQGVVVNLVKSGLIYEHYKEPPPSSAHLTLKITLEGITIIFTLEMTELRPREVN